MRRIHHFGIVGAACLIMGLFSFTGLRAQQNTRPNIILILTDDLGWTSLSALMDQRLANSKSDYHETPAMEKMASQGMRFSRGYAPDPICTPSRRSIQFGQTSLRQGDEEFRGRYAEKSRRAASIPEVLKSIDPTYATAHFGKWDLRAGITPAQLGYDESDGDTGNRNGDFVDEREDKWNKKYLIENPKQVDSLTNRSVRFMARQVKQGNPFYLQISHYATHVNFETRAETYQKFVEKKKGKIHDHPAWAGMIRDLDASIGKVLDALDSLSISENTYVFFMADNGAVEYIPPVSNRLDHPDVFEKPMRNSPLRGGKWTLYEGGIRVPFIVKGPGIKPGSQSDEPVAGWDLLPTFCELAGGNVDQSRDGGSFASLLTNGGKGKIRRSENAFYFHRFHNTYPHSAIMVGDFKLIRFWKTGKVELYNLANDPGEKNDLYKSDSKRAKQLEDRLYSYMRRVNPSLANLYSIGK